jgi:NAD(P)-dependent dehydrogenase (short-subunit alcohol dehydrogenase family)
VASPVADLAGKVAVVAGASRGIGAVTAQAFAEAGAPILTHHLRAAGERAQEMAAQSTRMRRIGQAREVADAVLWLCCEQSAFITGVTLPLDGGQSAGQKPPRMYRQGEPM